MAVSTSTFFAWTAGAGYPYDKWDVVWGAGLSVTDSRYFYSLIGNNQSQRPLATFSYTPISCVREGNVNRMSFTQTGTVYFQPGSIVEIANIEPDGTTCYSGVVLAAGAGYVDYINPGLDVTNTITAGSLQAPMHPYWTTGFAWIPGWGPEITHNQLVYNSPLGEGYSQRMNPVINSNNLNWNLVFENRTDKEAVALLNFLEDKGGVIPFRLPFPVAKLYNNPNLKYIGAAASHSAPSYNVNTVTVNVQQVFDL